MLFFKKINAGLSPKLILSGLAALTLFSIFSSCHIYNLSLEDFLKEWTETARVAESRISPEPVYKDSYAHIASGEDTLITYKLINPQNYDLGQTLFWENGSPPVSGTDYYFEQDANDKNILYLTLKKDFLEGLDGTGAKISPSLTLTETKSGRTFGTYSVPALVNSAPPAVILPVVLRTDGDAGNETYVICFNLPEMTGIHRDVTTLKIGSPYERTYTVNTDGTLSGGGTELTITYDTDWKPVTENGAKFIGDRNNRFVGIVTNVPLSGDLTSFTLSLVDEYGLSTSVTASTRASKLPSVTASPTGGIITINGTVEFSNPVPGATLVLESDNWDGVKNDGTGFSGEINEAGPITLTFTEPRTYNITAYAQMSGAADSDKVTFTYKVVDDSTVYVSEIGDDNNPGTEDKPVATLQRALDLLNKALFTEGKIVVTGTVQTGEVKITAPDDSTNGSVTTLTVRGGSAGGTLKNENGRVFNIASGGSLTLEENITLTGTNDAGNGGAVYVNGGNFIMKNGSKITGSSAKYGGGVYVDDKGTFTMDGGTISKNDASGDGASGGGVCISGGTFTMSGGAVISKNTAASSGGGVFVSERGDFTMKGGTIGGPEAGSANSAENGGGVYIHKGTFTMSGSAVINGNKASSISSSGGGVYIHNGTFTMSDSAVISGNTATSSGGGVYVSTDGTFTMEGGTIGGTDVASPNSSESGGGVCVYRGDFTMSDGSISRNTATDSGGGVFVQDGTFTMKSTAIIQENETTGGSSHACGGGVYVNGGEFTMTGTAIIQDNEATGSSGYACGGGVYVNVGEFTMNGDAIIQGNEAAGIIDYAGGGGVYVNGGGEFTMNDSAIIQKNNASTDETSKAAAGGGVYLTGGGTFSMVGNAKIQENKVTGSNGYAGGGVVVYGNCTFTMSGGIISGNSANNGGGVYVDSNGEFTMSGGTITGNTATQNGGGMYAAGGTFTVSGSSLTITGNTANNVYLASGNTITIGEDGLAGGEIGVTAENVPSGSAVPITDEYVTGADGIFTSDNPDYSIVKYNGAVYLSDTETVYVANSGTETFGTFADALSAVKSLGGTITLLKNIEGTNSVFEDDFSKPQPITFSSDDETRSFILDLNGKTINRELSTPTTDGSVIKIEGGALTIKDSSATNSDGTGTITGGNSDGGGGGIHITSTSIGHVSGSLILESGTVSGNFADGSNGGGVYIASDCTFTMKGGSIEGNTVKNSATSHGGGVFVGGTFTMENGIITNNSSEQGNGGGVNIGRGGVFTMSGGTISDNDANMTGGGVNIDSDGVFTMSDGTISANNAGMTGGGVGVSTGNFTMSGGTLSGNTATNGNGGGVFVDGGSSNFIMTGGTIGGAESNTAVLGGGVYVSSTGSFEIGTSTAVSSPVVSGNTKTGNFTNNVYLDDTILLIAGKLQKTEAPGNIGITMTTPGVFTSYWSNSGLTDSTFFFSDDTERTVALSGSELSLNLVRVEGGSCTLNNKQVTLSDFWISPYEVTQAEFENIMTGNANGITPNFNHKDTSLESGEVQKRRPADTVRWFEAIVYCNLLSIKEGLTPCYTIKGSTDPADWRGRPDSQIHENYNDWNSVTCNFDADGYRLPTEAEWEYAARGGKPGMTDSTWSCKYSGSDTPENVAWYSSNSGSKTHEVGKKQANALRLYDMSGNLKEWCWNRKSEDVDSRVMGGGYYSSAEGDCQVTAFDSNIPISQSPDQGFRVVRTIR